MPPYKRSGINRQMSRMMKPSTQLLNGSVQNCSNLSIKNIVSEAQKSSSSNLQDVIHSLSIGCNITFPSNAGSDITSVGATSVGATSGSCCNGYTVSSSSSCPNGSITYIDPCTGLPTNKHVPICVTWTGCV
jgi:hypothetical protein